MEVLEGGQADAKSGDKIIGIALTEHQLCRGALQAHTQQCMEKWISKRAKRVLLSTDP